jgi:cytochrome c oxidase subunit 3
MSVQAISQEGHGHGHAHPPEQAHQFSDMPQQNEAYVVGMWSFLVTEIMFFGALFLAYSTYRTMNPKVFIDAHKHLNVFMGGTNTVVLLTSSFFMAMGVWNAQLKRRTGQLFWIALTILCAFAFLGIKTVEYRDKFEHHLFPGATFHYESVEEHGGPSVTAAFTPERSNVPQGKAEMFFVLYFIMTGLHGIHVIIGILVLGTMWLMIKARHPVMEYYMWVEMAGLYWHFVDIVWIFLFPLYYLIPGT